jgi:Uma2 family endonuclease
MYQSKPDITGKPFPTMYDLPSDYPEDSGLPDEFHLYQPQVLSQTCKPPIYESDRVFIASDLNLYYDLNHLNWYKRPDWFVVINGTRLYQDREMRQSYVLWDEGKSPLLVVELISEGTEAEDLGRNVRKIGSPPTKWEVYEQILQVPYYITFDERNSEFRKFRWQNGKYAELDREATKLWIDEMQLGLGICHGAYQGIEADWLRWYDADEVWLPTQEERTAQERQRAEQERQRAEQERQRAEQERQRAEQECQRAEQERQRAEQEQQKVEALKAQLRALGIEPDL